MNKKKSLWAILDLIFLIVFNVVFFVVSGTTHETSVWISYGFIHFSYIMLLITPFLIRKSNSAAVFGFTLYSISSSYFFLSFVVGVIFILVHPDTYKWSLIIQVIIAGFYAIMLLSHMIANEYTADSVEKHEVELRYVKDSAAHVKHIMDNTTDRQLKKRLENVYDILHASPIKSSSAVREYEETVMSLIDVLENNVNRNDDVVTVTTIEKIVRNANERNRRLKYGR